MSGESPGIIAATGLNNSKLEKVDEAIDDPGQVHFRSSGPLTSQTLLRERNESGNTSRTRNGTSNTRACDRPPTRRRERSDDERRLLGDYEKDPDAVPINRPQNPSWQGAMTPSILQGGKRPINTLGSVGSTLKKLNNELKGVALYGFHGLKRGYQGGCHHGLDIVTSSGDNVVKAFDLHADRNQGPPKKKARTTATPGTLNDSGHSTKMDDDNEIVMWEKAEPFPPFPRKNSYNSSILSQGSEVISNPQPPRGRAAGVRNQEYLAVEDIMRSRPQGRRRSRNSQPITVTSGTIPGVTIDLSADDHVVPNRKQSYQGTARETKTRAISTGLVQEKLRKDRHEKETGMKSRHFGNAKQLKISSSMRGSNARSPIQQVELVDLRTRFVDDKGNRRDSLMGDSPDELQNGTTVGCHSYERQPSPAQVPLGSREPLENISTRPVTPPYQVQGLPESNIPRTEFTSSGRRSRKINRVEKVPRDRRQPIDWGVDLLNFKTGGADLHGRRGCGLVYDAIKEQFVAIHQGQDLSQDIPQFSINPKRVGRILMGDGNSCKLRLFLSQSTNPDSRTDIELGTHEDVVDLVEKLQHMVPGIKVMTSGKMDRIFENRTLEVDPRLRTDNTPTTDTGDDIQLLQIKERRKKAQAGTVDLGPEVYGKRLSRIDKFDAMGKLRRMSIPGDQPQNSRKPSNPLQRTIAAGQDREGGFNTHQRQISSKHQTRSQMQQSASDSPIPTKSSPEPPPEKRYSKIHGLGSPWPKPLVFPQAGKRKSTVEFEDLQRLDEGEFLNDNLMGFYLRYLEYQLEQNHPELAQKIYFFNTYFFASLTNTPRGKKGVNYEAVQKWTRTVDIFAFDYVVVPINESAHWYVAIICNLPALDRNLEAEDETDLQATVNVSSDNAPSLSSRAPSTSAVDEIENKAALYDIDADGTRNSFAEMNLEGKQEPYNHDMAVNSMLEAELSHCPNEELGKDDGSLVQPIKPVLEIAEALPSTAQLLNDDSPSSPRKGRRKSTGRLQKYEPGSPIIITLDSLGLSHSPTVRILKDYLAQEGKAKRALEFPDDAIKGMTAKGIPLQNNFCDCGLYLLGYLEKLVQNPQDLCHKILQRELDVDVDWPSLNPSHMRDQLRARIQELQAQQEAERKEAAKKTGKYISREDTKPVTSLGSSEFSPSGALPKVDEGPKPGSKAAREIALKSAIPLDQQPQPKVRTIRRSPMVVPSPEDLNNKEKGLQPVVPTGASQEDTPVFLGEKPVSRGTSGLRDMDRPIRESKEEIEHTSGNPTGASPMKYLEKVEILARNPTFGDSDMLGV